MNPFNAKIVNSKQEDPYSQKNDFYLVKHNKNKLYNGNNYEKLTYKKKYNVCWRIANGSLALLACVTIIPLCLNSKYIKKLWKQVTTGEQIKVVLIARHQLNQNPFIEKPLDVVPQIPLNQQPILLPLNQPPEVPLSKEAERPEKIKEETIPQALIPTWRPRTLRSDLAMVKMLINSAKAVKEHRKKDLLNSFISSKDAVPSLEAMMNNQPLSPLKLSHFAAEAQGPRDAMEDAHFYKEIAQGSITGVFDGHGGKDVAEFANKMFQEKFSEALAKNKGNVHQTFEELIHKIHEEVMTHHEWDKIGSTAVICFIDKNTHQIYTATLGDSEANIYRKVNEQLKSIPLSCVRDWSSVKDAKRASIALNYPQIAEDWPKVKNPKHLRYFPICGINISRTIGDKRFTVGMFDQTKEGVIHKPKITVNLLQPDDVLILACDGLKDYVQENEIVAKLAKSQPGENLAKSLVDYAIKNKNSKDNVTIVALKIS